MKIHHQEKLGHQDEHWTLRWKFNTTIHIHYEGKNSSLSWKFEITMETHHSDKVHHKDENLWYEIILMIIIIIKNLHFKLRILNIDN